MFINTCSLCMFFYPVPESLTRHTMSPAGNKQMLSRSFLKQFRASFSHVAPEPVKRFIAHWYQALFTTLANDSDNTLHQTELVGLELYELRHGQPGSI